jgi:hypothetical protein
MQRCLGVPCLLDWQVVLTEGCSNWKKKTMLGVLCWLVFGSAMYGLWKARNAIRFCGVPSSDEQILKMILWEVRIRISRKGSFKKTRENVRICQLWNLADSVLN